MSAQDYRSCMATKMGSGVLKGLEKSQRTITFCALAKECSKGISHDEAIKICAAMPPKPPKAPRQRRARATGTGDGAGCPVATCDVSALIPHCEDVLKTWLPSDIGINPVRICGKIFEQGKGK
jgi:hypothetical protein